MRCGENVLKSFPLCTRQGTALLHPHQAKQQTPQPCKEGLLPFLSWCGWELAILS